MHFKSPASDDIVQLTRITPLIKVKNLSELKLNFIDRQSFAVNYIYSVKCTWNLTYYACIPQYSEQNEKDFVVSK